MLTPSVSPAATACWNGKVASSALDIAKRDVLEKLASRLINSVDS
jgi:hypothetical protein